MNPPHRHVTHEPIWLGTLPKLNDGVPTVVRERMMSRLRRLLREIDLDRSTVEYWNSMHPDEEPIEYDPGGTMARIRFQVVAALEDGKR